MTTPYYDIDQDEWGAQKVFPDGGLTGDWNPDKIIIHYGGNASLGATDPADPVKERQALRIYEQSHLSRGWRAIGYNYAIGQSGLIYRLRGENMSGATSGDYEGDGIKENNEGRAVLWIGGLGQEPSKAAYASMGRMIREAGLLTIAHSDVKHNTGCPGDFWRDWIADEGWKVECGMPYEQFKNMVDAMFVGSDEFAGDPSYFYRTIADGGIYDDPDNVDWVNFWDSFVRLIGG